MKVLEIIKGGSKWHVPVEEIAANRAKYYAGRDADTTYQEEFDYTMSSSAETIDWYFNNMDPEDASIILVEIPKVQEWPDDFNCRVKEVDYGQMIGVRGN